MGSCNKPLTTWSFYQGRGHALVAGRGHRAPSLLKRLHVGGIVSQLKGYWLVEGAPPPC